MRFLRRDFGEFIVVYGFDLHFRWRFFIFQAFFSVFGKFFCVSGRFFCCFWINFCKFWADFRRFRARDNGFLGGSTRFLSRVHIFRVTFYVYILRGVILTVGGFRCYNIDVRRKAKSQDLSSFSNDFDVFSVLFGINGYGRRLFWGASIFYELLEAC